MSFPKPNFKPLDDFQTKWVTSEIDDDCINYLENFGFFLCAKKAVDDRFAGRDGMTASQIRNVFGAIKQIEAKGTEDINWAAKFRMLRPKMAYAAARVKSSSPFSRISEFREVFEKAHIAVQGNFQNFERFSQIIEGAVAYHKVYGGKD